MDAFCNLHLSDLLNLGGDSTFFSQVKNSFPKPNPIPSSRLYTFCVCLGLNCLFAETFVFYISFLSSINLNLNALSLKRVIKNIVIGIITIRIIK